MAKNHEQKGEVMMPNKCPYNLDCIPDEACENCQGEVECIKCKKMAMIPIGRRICFDCFERNKR